MPLDAQHTQARQRARAKLKDFARQRIMRQLPTLTAGQVEYLAQHPETMQQLIATAGGDTEIVQRLVGNSPRAKEP